MHKKQTSSDFEIAPLRSLGDFLLEAARFQIPNVKDFERWGNRVTQNLLYYQTNYFLMSILIFIIVGIIHPIKMACGILATAVLFMIFVYITNEKASAARFKKRHPIVSIFVIFACAYFLAYMLQSLMVFLLGVLLPVAAIFIHASLRLRNMKNKIANKVESLGLRTTPMGFFLEEMGLEIYS
ncbi:PRA1 family protein 3 isoform X2 [Diorhabda sublineata]|uniref:PRA1 family protein 3 isoform X2 n=1 Tax=Diorhabda sublineata TaxID=1163346 RepID=UPI0024E0E948|nr:PRA1 family protein 3 isoform X2 [Diorhabda sublineata]